MERLHDQLYSPVYDDITVRRIDDEFRRLRDQHYLDHAGATLYSDSQMKKVSDDMRTSLYANPHSYGVAGNSTREIIDCTRYRILDHFHASAEDYSLVFTSGATAALKIVAETFRFREESQLSDGESGNFVYVQDNHTSVLGMRDVVGRKGAAVSCLERDRAFKIFSKKSNVNERSPNKNNNSLFVYSAQCNFSGTKYPLDWISHVHEGVLDRAVGKNGGRWYVLLDAAAFVGTNDLDLSTIKPDFVCISFYKMFGYPCGTGALLVRKSSEGVLDKVYYGGGTVNLALSTSNFHVKRDVFHERFEDGTLPFLSIISLRHGLDAMSIVSIDKISKHVFSLARYLHRCLTIIHHRNGKPVAIMYCDNDYESVKSQGGIVTFNLLRSNGDYVGYTEVTHVAALYSINLRTGCFCNPGACQRHLGLNDDDVMKNYQAGYTCGGSRDLIDGKPVGAIRISFGYMSRRDDVEAVVRMITEYFVDRPEIIKVPNDWTNKVAIIDDRNENFSHDLIYADVEKLPKTVDDDKTLTDETMPGEMTNGNGNFELARLFIYPIKSCAAFEITDRWLLADKGLRYDREWMIVTSAGICLSQKQHVNLCMLRPFIDLENNTMTLSYPGMPSMETRLDFTFDEMIEGKLCRSRVCGHKVEGIDCGAEISEWLSLALGRPNLRLIRQNNDKKRKNDEFNKSELSFSSQAQYLLVNEASVNSIIKQLSDDSDCSRETILYRFRGNIVLRGAVPFEETTWSRVRIGNNVFKVDGPCTRCQMICIDQTTGKKTVEPLRMLAKQPHGKITFGIYLSRQSNKSSVIEIGDTILCL